MEPFLIPDDFRAFMKQVVRDLDAPFGDPEQLDAADAFRHATGYGGRVASGAYRFTYVPPGGGDRWTVQLAEAAVRDIADGLLIEVMGERVDERGAVRRRSEGQPLLIWGEYGDDALAVRDHDELLAALDSLHSLAQEGPRLLRMWSPADDQLVAMIRRDDCALYVVKSPHGYATSCGDAARTGSFEIADHDGRPLAVPRADCVPWSIARNALLQFAERGELGPEIRVEGRIPTGLLMMGDVDRATVLAARAEPPGALARSSLPRLMTVREETVPPVDTQMDQTLDEGIFVTIPAAAETAEDSVVTASVPTIAVPARAPVVAVAAEDSAAVAVAVAAAAPLQGDEPSAWARRLIEHLYARELIELGRVSLDEITYQLGGLLQAHGAEAQRSLDTAEWLANEIGAVRGIEKLFATGGDLQIALRRSRTP